jgi:hypothetical protein
MMKLQRQCLKRSNSVYGQELSPFKRARPTGVAAFAYMYGYSFPMVRDSRSCFGLVHPSVGLLVAIT